MQKSTSSPVRLLYHKTSHVLIQLTLGKKLKEYRKVGIVHDNHGIIQQLHQPNIFAIQNHDDVVELLQDFIQYKLTEPSNSAAERFNLPPHKIG